MNIYLFIYSIHYLQAGKLFSLYCTTIVISFFVLNKAEYLYFKYYRTHYINEDYNSTFATRKIVENTKKLSMRNLR